MSQIKPMGLVESMSGKICGHSDMYFFRKNGKVFSGKICNPSTKEPTATQLAAQAKFKTARTNAKAALADPEQKAILEAAFKAQKKYYSLYGYVLRKNMRKYRNHIGVPRANRSRRLFAMGRGGSAAIPLRNEVSQHIASHFRRGYVFAQEYAKLGDEPV